MSEEATEATPVESAPVSESSVTSTPAAAAAADTPVAAAAETPIAAAAAKAESAADSSPEEMRTAPTHDTFGWDDWDGSADALPEGVRGWYGKFDERHKSALGTEQTRYAELDKLFNAYLQDGSDPRLQEAQAALEKSQADYAELQGHREAWDAQRKLFEGEISRRDQQAEEEAAAWSRWFLDQNKDVLSDPKVKDAFGQALEGGWDPEDAIQFIQMPEDARKEAAAALAEGTPSSRALKFGQLTAAQKSMLPPPRDAASVVAGAEGGPARPHRSQRSLNDGASLKDMRGLVARNALRKHGKAGG